MIGEMYKNIFPDPQQKYAAILEKLKWYVIAVFCSQNFLKFYQGQSRPQLSWAEWIYFQLIHHPRNPHP